MYVLFAHTSTSCQCHIVNKIFLPFLPNKLGYTQLVKNKMKLTQKGKKLPYNKTFYAAIKIISKYL